MHTVKMQNVFNVKIKINVQYDIMVSLMYNI